MANHAASSVVCSPSPSEHEALDATDRCQLIAQSAVKMLPVHARKRLEPQVSWRSLYEPTSFSTGKGKLRGHALKAATEAREFSAEGRKRLSSPYSSIPILRHSPRTPKSGFSTSGTHRLHAHGGIVTVSDCGMSHCTRAHTCMLV